MRSLIIFFFLHICFFGYAQPKTKIVLLGTFHFDNPGLDVAKFEGADILSSRRQQEVADVLAALKRLNPDKIFVEYPMNAQLKLDSSYTNFAAGKTRPAASETQQLGYQLARELNHKKLYAIDYNDSDFPFDSLMKSAEAANQGALLEKIGKLIDSIENDFNLSLKTKTVREMLLQQNDPRVNRLQISFYFDLLIAGSKGNHVGSYLTSEWWRRNMVIYENMLKSLDGSEKTILVIFGSGHTAILDEMIRYSSRFEIIPATEVLR